MLIYSCSHTVKTIAFKRNPSGRTRIYEYAPPPPIIGLSRALAATPRLYFPNIYLTWSISNWPILNIGPRCGVNCCHDNTIFLKSILHIQSSKVKLLESSSYETSFQIYVFENWNLAYPTSGKHALVFLRWMRWSVMITHDTQASTIIDELYRLR
jgi:hypothetical protein